ncbi:hypothetical protein DMA11_03425 [Marinilabiliaceae bacterium JC017]|nr:hypothetical protein DMA11_03425 [Marinilabiliaceae bacterium JC017]
MNATNIINRIRDTLRDYILEVDIMSTKRATIHINPAALIATARFLLSELKFRFIIASALQSKKGFEILYHFSYDPLGLIINIHLLLSTDNPEVESLCPLLTGANWIEREIHELFGINFLNHPNLEKLISEGNWAEGVYPYRRTEGGEIDQKKSEGNRG